MGNLVQFFQKVRIEVGKVTWPARRETFVTTVMVFVMVFVACLFFLIVDLTEKWLVALVLGLGR